MPLKEVNLLVTVFEDNYSGFDVTHLGLVWTPEEIKNGVEKKVSVLLDVIDGGVELPSYYHTDLGTGDLRMPWFMSIGSPNLCCTDFSKHDGFLKLRWNEVNYIWSLEKDW